MKYYTLEVKKIKEWIISEGAYSFISIDKWRIRIDVANYYNANSLQIVNSN